MKTRLELILLFLSMQLFGLNAFSKNCDKLQIKIATLGPLYSGKTTLTSAISFVQMRKGMSELYSFDIINSHPNELERGMTMYIRDVMFETENYKYALYDCPGHEDYIWKSYNLFDDIDGAIIVLDATDGCDGRNALILENILREAKDHKLDNMIIFCNKRDMVGDQVLLDLMVREIKGIIKRYDFDINTPILFGSALGALNNVPEYMNDIEILLETCDKRFSKNAKKTHRTEQYDGMTYIVNKYNSEAKLVKCAPMPLESVAIPRVIKAKGKDYLVTSIGDFAFAYNSSVEHVDIPNTVKTIGKFAFNGCYNLCSINIPHGVETICECAFDGCCRLIDIDFPNSLLTICDGAFANCQSLEPVNIPNSVSLIGKHIFQNIELDSIIIK